MRGRPRGVTVAAPAPVDMVGIVVLIGAVATEHRRRGVVAFLEFRGGGF